MSGLVTAAQLQSTSIRTSTHTRIYVYIHVKIVHANVLTNKDTANLKFVKSNVLQRGRVLYHFLKTN